MKLFQLVASSFLFYSCSAGLSTSDLETVLENNRKELTQVSIQFLKHKEIRWVTIFTDYDSLTCQSINGWLNCPSQGKKWKTWSDSLQTDIYLSSRDEVLKHENIDPNTFAFFRNFLKSHKLTTIRRVYASPENCVEFESINNGLRFYTVQPNSLKEDYEYLKVKRIDANWFVYMRDWN